MTIVPLPLAAPKRDRQKDAIFDRTDCLGLAKRVLAATTLGEAAAIIRVAGKALPPTVQKTNRARDGWHEYFLRLAKALARGRAAIKVFSEKGNTKLPFVAFGTLPYFSCPGMGACAKHCYSPKAWRYPAGFGRQLQNTLLMRFGRDVVARAFRAIKMHRTVRLYTDGDFATYDEVAFWMGLCEERPDLDVYGYSKSWDLLAEFGEAGWWPDNYTLNLSSGGSRQTTTVEQMRALPITRGDFLALDISGLYTPKDEQGKVVRGNVGFKRYKDRQYHAAVRKTAKKLGIAHPFSCPGNCGSCTPHGHACGSDPRFHGLTIVNGIH